MGLYLKACPRCSGDFAKQEDMFGVYLQCYQCGFLRDLQIVESLADVNLKEFGERTQTPSTPSRAIQKETLGGSAIEPTSKIQPRPPTRITKDPREYKKAWVQRKKEAG